MYRYLSGLYKGPTPEADGTVVLEVAGIGYELVLPPIVEHELVSTHQIDDNLTLFVSPQSGRDQPWPTLFGFLRAEERAFWELLKSVPRVGGKGAARSMALPIQRIAEAIQDGNRVVLDGLPGVTLDGADKIIAALRKKVGPFVVLTSTDERARPRTAADETREDAVALLAGPMGLKRPDAQRAVDRILADREDLTSVQDIVNEYFRLQREGGGRSAGPRGVAGAYG